MLELRQCLRFDLPDPLPRQFETLAYFFERVRRLFANSEAHAQNLFLAPREGREDSARVFRKVHPDHSVRRGRCPLVLDKIGKRCIRVLPDGGFEGDGVFRELQYLVYG